MFFIFQITKNFKKNRLFIVKMQSQSVQMLTQSTRVYHVHTEHPTLEKVYGEIEIYDLPLEERLIPKYQSAMLEMGVIDLKSSSGSIIAGYIDWSKIPQADSYRGKVTGQLRASKKLEFLIADDVVPDYIEIPESSEFNDLATEIVRLILEQDSQRKS